MSVEQMIVQGTTFLNQRLSAYEIAAGKFAGAIGDSYTSHQSGYVVHDVSGSTINLSVHGQMESVVFAKDIGSVTLARNAAGHLTQVTFQMNPTSKTVVMLEHILEKNSGFESLIGRKLKPDELAGLRFEQIDADNWTVYSGSTPIGNLSGRIEVTRLHDILIHTGEDFGDTFTLRADGSGKSKFADLARPTVYGLHFDIEEQALLRTIQTLDDPNLLKIALQTIKKGKEANVHEHMLAFDLKRAREFLRDNELSGESLASRTLSVINYLLVRQENYQGLISAARDSIELPSGYLPGQIIKIPRDAPTRHQVEVQVNGDVSKKFFRQVSKYVMSLPENIRESLVRSNVKIIIAKNKEAVAPGLFNNGAPAWHLNGRVVFVEEVATTASGRSLFSRLFSTNAASTTGNRLGEVLPHQLIGHALEYANPVQGESRFPMSATDSGVMLRQMSETVDFENAYQKSISRWSLLSRRLPDGLIDTKTRPDADALRQALASLDEKIRLNAIREIEEAVTIRRNVIAEVLAARDPAGSMPPARARSILRRFKEVDDYIQESMFFASERLNPFGLDNSAGLRDLVDFS
ncbi:MAG: hypothetical protein K2X81_11835, partial [Candidatus Obscuribacterales bacterium]|nr:hypothetical protein [Candidatus Obscuribacterales bacterium]